MPPKSPKAGRKPGPLIVLALLACGVAYFGLQGGEYGTTDLVRQKARIARLQHDVDSLKHEVDSLERWRKAIETDPHVQERLAREEFGMVKGNKEILYRFAEAK